MSNVQRLEDWERQSETKSAKFTRLAGPRMAKVLADIKMLANLSNRSTYEFSRQQIGKMIADLHDEVDRLEDAFKAGNPDRQKLHYDL